MFKLAKERLSTKQKREYSVLLGFVELFLETGKPIGSNTLKENAFEKISSATIRNYFSRLEKEGYLVQQHASGGRIPTAEAYKVYAREHIDSAKLSPDHEELIHEALAKETRELSPYFQEAIEALSRITNGAVFLTSPRFDQDFIVEVKLTAIDEKRVLCIIITDFSMVHTEILYTDQKMSLFSLRRIEEYFHFRLTGLDKPTLAHEEEEFGKRAYNEVILRHFVMYTNFNKEDVYKCGFSKLLTHPEFYDPLIIASSLSIFENTNLISPLMHETLKKNSLCYWIGDDLKRVIAPPFETSIITIPYSINQKPVGAIAVLGPNRQHYPRVFAALKLFSQYLSEYLTKSLYKFKISYREPRQQAIDVRKSAAQAIAYEESALIEQQHTENS